jgi:hypothetical protein
MKIQYKQRLFTNEEEGYSSVLLNIREIYSFLNMKP